ncbi:hypothetical protein Vafri_14863 [Volvox africanus]|uniref:Uncharacterized protein n=1 Tax=Volvox africanus TaxID=51714 RepID=A0A8J4BFC2_9CHLO|nr:hypothetical protein Vafri_14863 [Volvox africanus]
MDNSRDCLPADQASTDNSRGDCLLFEVEASTALLSSWYPHKDVYTKGENEYGQELHGGPRLLLAAAAAAATTVIAAILEVDTGGALASAIRTDKTHDSGSSPDAAADCRRSGVNLDTPGGGFCLEGRSGAVLHPALAPGSAPAVAPPG